MVLSEDASRVTIEDFRTASRCDSSIRFDPVIENCNAGRASPYIKAVAAPPEPKYTKGLAMKTACSERLLAAALLGSVLGAVGCASTAAQSTPTTPSGTSAEKASCKGQHGCNGEGTPGESAGGVKADGEKASCKSHGSCKGQHGCSGEGTPGEAAGGVITK
jgi:hypothetical protein